LISHPLIQLEGKSSGEVIMRMLTNCGGANNELRFREKDCGGI